jgi:hypothetical protein
MDKTNIVSCSDTHELDDGSPKLVTATIKEGTNPRAKAIELQSVSGWYLLGIS